MLVVMESEMKREVASIEPDRAIVEKSLLVVRDRGSCPAEWRPRARCIHAVIRAHPVAPFLGFFFALRENRVRDSVNILPRLTSPRSVHWGL